MGAPHVYLAPFRPEMARPREPFGAMHLFPIYKSVILAQARTSGRMGRNADIALSISWVPDVYLAPFRPEMARPREPLCAMYMFPIYKSVILCEGIGPRAGWSTRPI
ncbi:hypothetical protein KL86PLE_90533 [uncultured Pleomorphomonas sp.]|uniref:Uncharacterized protein n=1 Tax=uncultured Pleomorphomonas sp. TaxID=442121 RepID=A0A212LQ87_9HYPH|nr:hypothetical protein KL86PLE_90533 [uncultured Pleomorphomonas sp.]